MGTNMKLIMRKKEKHDQEECNQEECTTAPKKRKWNSTSVIVMGISVVFFVLIAVFFGWNRWQVEITAKGASEITVEYGETVDVADVTATLKDSWFLKEGLPLKVQMEGDVDIETLGEYELVYQAGYGFLKKSFVRNITVVDTTAPEITLIEKEGFYTLPGKEYEEEGFLAFDEYDGDLTAQVQTQEKDGKVYYTVSDGSGNETTVERTILYNDPVAPEITLLGDASITITAGTQYTESGWQVTDNYEDLQNAVVTKTDLNIYRPGTYHIQYSVSDTFGNQGTASREIIVKGVPQPSTQPVDGKVIYLTFDDGPGPYTEKLLSILETYNVKATFFVKSGNYDHLIAKEAAAGHTVAIHTYTHVYKEIYASEEAYFNDLHKMQNVIYQQTGIRPTMVRFPGGSSNTVSRFNSGIMTRLAEALTAMGYQYFDWNVSSGDAGGTISTDAVFQNVVKGIGNKKTAIVLQHDIKGFSVDAVESIINWGIANGYIFLPLSETSPAVHHSIRN